MYRFLICSGKGGVGKTTVTVYLAKAFQKLGKYVGILDADINTPNVPTTLGVVNNKRMPMKVDDYRIQPHEIGGIKVVSYWFDTSDVPHLLWSQDRVGKILKAFCKDVDWGNTEILLVDCPPVTSDELVGVVSMIGHIDGAVIVVEGSTKVSIDDAKRAMRSLDYFNVPILGFVKNKVSAYFDEGLDVEKELGLPCLGEIKLKKRVKGKLTLSEQDLIPIANVIGQKVGIEVVECQ